jgi:knotted carbamoyltransferase YgeW
MQKDLNKLIEEITKKENGLFNDDFLLTWEKKPEDIELLLEVAKSLRLMREKNVSCKIFDTGLGVSIFRDNSTRTRFSFASALDFLGIMPHDFDEKKTQIVHGETVRETANMISFMAETVGIRDDMYIGEGNKYMREVAEALTEGHEKKVLPTRPNIVNLQCDLDHPTQSMADLSFLVDRFGSLEDLKGKKMVMSWAYSPSYGKPLSVPQGIITLMSRFGMDITLAHPKGYDLLPETLEIAKKHANESGGSFTMTNDKDSAFKDADIVYPKSWAPFSIMEQRTKIVKNNDEQALNDLEKTCLAENAKHKDWEYNEALKKQTKDGNALYMHCLPADITGVSCKEGEVQSDVFETHRIDTYQEASWKPYVIAAMIFASKVKNPGKKLNELLSKEIIRANV